MGNINIWLSDDCLHNLLTCPSFTIEVMLVYKWFRYYFIISSQNLVSLAPVR